MQLYITRLRLVNFSKVFASGSWVLAKLFLKLAVPIEIFSAHAEVA